MNTGDAGEVRVRVVGRDAQSKRAAKKAIENYFSQLFEAVRLEKQLKAEMEDVLMRVESDEVRATLRVELSRRVVDSVLEARRPVSLASFERVAEIGRGSFGKVYLVRQKGSGEYFAMKKIPKLLQQKKSMRQVWAERKALTRLDLEGVAQLEFSFQDRKYVYLVMEFMPGGDLMTRLIHERTLSEEQTRFYLAEIIVAVNQVHEQGVIHRDLKPDNFVFTADGHLKLLDFGLCESLPKRQEPPMNSTQAPDRERQRDIASKWSSPEHRRHAWKKILRHRRQPMFSAVGTPNYMAPEVILREESPDTPYFEESDWWSVGVIMFEMLVGFPPFGGGDVFSTCYRVAQWQRYFAIPDDVVISDEAVDLIKRLICEPHRRMGSGSGVSEFKAHPFFRGFDWSSIYSQEAPWQPQLAGPEDLSYFDDDVGSAPSSSSAGAAGWGDEDDDCDVRASSERTRTSLSHYLAEAADYRHFAGFSYRRIKNTSLTGSRGNLEKWMSVPVIRHDGSDEPSQAAAVRSVSETPKVVEDLIESTENILSRPLVFDE